MKIEMYSEELSTYIAKVHDAANSRYNLTGYDLHVIEAALVQLQDSEVLGTKNPEENAI